MNYKVVGSTSGLKVGQVITEESLKNEHKRLGGAERLLALKAIEPTSETSTPVEPDPRAPELQSGSPEPLRKDMDRDEAIALNVTGGAPDSAAKANPAKGGPGTIKAAKKPE